jgi:hypothetical protein
MKDREWRVQMEAELVVRADASPPLRRFWQATIVTCSVAPSGIAWARLHLSGGGSG